MLIALRKAQYLFCTLAASVFLLACSETNGDAHSLDRTESTGDGQSLDLTKADLTALTPPIKHVQILHNGSIFDGLPIRFESFDAPALAELRDQENLDAVVAGATDEFDKMLLLKEWVSAQWPAGNPNPYPPWNALKILSMIRSGETGGFCAQYAQVLMQSLASFGMSARYIEIGSTSNPYAHYVLEAWSNQYNKWVMLDADYNLYFERAGIPLSALDIHDALVHSQLADVVAVRGTFREGHSKMESWPLHTAELYYYVRYHLKGNHLSVPDENSFNRTVDAAEWNDSETVPWDQSVVESIYPKGRLTNLVTTDRSLAESALNQVVVSVQTRTDHEVILNLTNNEQSFAKYQIRVTNKSRTAGEWRDHNASVLTWRPFIFASVLEVRAVNSRDVPGPNTIVATTFEQELR